MQLGENAPPPEKGAVLGKESAAGLSWTHYGREKRIVRASSCNPADRAEGGLGKKNFEGKRLEEPM
jgi:hypothetical protein